MGALNSKVEISVPPSPTCFPTYDNEDELSDNIAKLSECHLQAVQISSWIASVVCPAYSGHVVVTIASYLLTFLIHRMSSSEGPQMTSTPKRRNLNNSQYGNGTTTLESGLIDVKVSESIARKSVCELKAKLYVIQNRYLRLISEISPDERRLEVVPVIQACEEVLQLFSDPEHVFRQNPIVSAPFVASFGGVFLTIAEICIKLIPSYTEELANEMNLMIDTINAYQSTCIEARMAGVTLKTVRPSSMLDAASGRFSEFSYQMEDSFSSFKTCLSSGSDQRMEPNRIYTSPREAMEVYKNEIEEQYKSFFEPVIQNLLNFTPFQNAEDNIFNLSSGTVLPDGECSSDND